MPKKSIDYSKIVVYKIVCKDLKIKDSYVGSTTDFTERKYNHKSTCNNPKDKHYGCNVYEFIRKNGGWENWTMILVEEYPCKSKLEALKRERYWFETLNATLNTNKGIGMLVELGQEEYRKYKYNNNKERELAVNKEYRENHKKEIALSKKEYFALNKDKINEHRLSKYACKCGSTVALCRKARHLKTKKHIKFEESQ